MSPPQPDNRQQAQGKIPAQGGIDGGAELAVAGGMEDLGAVADQLHGHLRVAQGQVGDNAGDGGTLGGVLLHKFHAGGGVVKQVPDADGGALGAAGLGDLAGHAAL